MNCPNKNHPEYKALVEEHGPITALVMWSKDQIDSNILPSQIGKIEDLFASNSELYNIGTSDQYLEYLNDIGVTQVAYHHSDTNIEKFTSFGIRYFPNELKKKGTYYKEADDVVFFVKKPLTEEFMSKRPYVGTFGLKVDKVLDFNAGEKIGDGVHPGIDEGIKLAVKGKYDAVDFGRIRDNKTWSEVIAITNPNNAIKLGFLQDVEDFRNFVKSKGSITNQTVFNQKIESTKAISNYNHSVLFDEYLNLLKKKFPNIKIESDYYNENWNSKIENGVVKINLKTVTADSLIDEYGHIWFALLKQKDPELATVIINEMKASDLFNHLKETIYNTLYKSDEEIAEEVFCKMLISKIKNENEQSLVNSFYTSLKNFLKRLFGKGYTVNELLNEAAKDLLKNPSNLDSDQLNSLIDGVRYNITTLPADSSQLIEMLSDKEFNLTEKFVKRKVSEILELYPDGIFFMNRLDKTKNINPHRYNPNDPKKAEKIANEVKKYYKQQLDETVNFIINRVNKGDLTPNDKVDIDQQSKLKIILGELWPNFIVGKCKVMTYKQMMKEYNIGSSEFDSDHILVMRDEKGNFSVLGLVTGTMGEAKNDRSMISGISSKWGKFFGNSVVKYANDIKLSNSLQTRTEVLANLAAMSIVKDGGKVNNVTVGNLSTKYGGNFKHSDSSLIIDQIKKLLGISIIQDQLSDIFKNLIKDKRVLNTSNYEINYIDDLINFSTNDFVIDDIVKDIDVYRSGNVDVIAGLIEKIERKIMTLSRNYSDQEQDKLIRDHPEFLLLSKTLKELTHAKKELLKEYTKQDSVLQWTTSLTSISNPYINWWVEMWNKARNLVTMEFEKYQLVRNKVFANIQKNPSDSNWLYENRSALYKDVYVFENGKNTFTLKVPGTSEFNALSKEHQQFVTGLMDIIKKLYHMSFMQYNGYKDDSQTLFETEYEASAWAKGKIPLIRSSFTSQLYSKNVGKAFSTMFEELLNENMNYEDKYDNYNSLKNQIYGQSTITKHNELLGENLEYSEDFEPDINRIMNLFSMQTFKHKHMTGLIGVWKAARSMMHITENELGLADESGKQSQDIALLDSIVKALVFNETEKLSKGLGDLINKATNAASTITTWAALGVNPLTSITSFASNIANLVIRSFAGAYDYTLTEITSAAFSILSGKDFEKAVALGGHLRLIATDEFDMIHNRKQAGERMTLADMRNNWLLDRSFDSFVKMMMLTAKLKKQGIWDSYSIVDGALVYDENKDKRFEGKDGAVLKAFIKNNLITEGVMLTGDKMPSAYDNSLRINLEKEISEVIGGYTDATKTRAGFNIFGQAVSKFRVYQLGRIERAIIGRGTDAGKVDYRVIDGEIHQDVAVSGILQSFRKAISTIAYYKSLSPEALANIDSVDKKNIRITLMFLTTATMMYMFTDSEEERKKKKKRSVYDNILSDINTVDNLKTAWRILENPLVSVSYMSKLTDMLFNYMVFDFEDANKSAFKNLGFLRTLGYVKDSFK